MILPTLRSGLLGFRVFRLCQDLGLLGLLGFRILGSDLGVVPRSHPYMYMALPKLGLPYCGPYYKGILYYFGVYIGGPLSWETPQISMYTGECMTSILCSSCHKGPSLSLSSRTSSGACCASRWLLGRRWPPCPQRTSGTRRR